MREDPFCSRISEVNKYKPKREKELVRSFASTGSDRVDILLEEAEISRISRVNRLITASSKSTGKCVIPS